ncbi:MAG: DMT family transporter [Paracoccaceae bacterium]|nr:DMT family transporter [Paracoccaceae bacterium]
MGNSSYPINLNLNKRAAVFLILCSSILISFNGLTIRSLDTTDALLINIYRSVALVFTVSLFSILKTKTPFAKQIRSIGWPGVWGGILLGSANIFFLQAITNTSVANALFTISAIPFITALLAYIFLKEKLQTTTMLTMVFASVGIYIMFSSGVSNGQMYGNIMALLTALVFSSFAIIARKYRAIDMIPTLILAGIISGLIGFFMRFNNLGISLNDLFLCFLLGGILSGMANCGFVIASRHLVAAEVTLYMFIEFALGPLWVWIFANETISEASLVGGLIIMASVLTKTIFQLKKIK